MKYPPLASPPSPRSKWRVGSKYAVLTRWPGPRWSSRCSCCASKTLISHHATNFDRRPSDPCGGMMGDNGQAVMHRINVQILLHQTEPTRHLFSSASPMFTFALVRFLLNPFTTKRKYCARSRCLIGVPGVPNPLSLRFIMCHELFLSFPDFRSLLALAPSSCRREAGGVKKKHILCLCGLP